VLFAGCQKIVFGAKRTNRSSSGNRHDDPRTGRVQTWSGWRAAKNTTRERSSRLARVSGKSRRRLSRDDDGNLRRYVFGLDFARGRHEVNVFRPKKGGEVRKFFRKSVRRRNPRLDAVNINVAAPARTASVKSFNRRSLKQYIYINTLLVVVKHVPNRRGVDRPNGKYA